MAIAIHDHLVETRLAHRGAIPFEGVTLTEGRCVGVELRQLYKTGRQAAFDATSLCVANPPAAFTFIPKTPSKMTTEQIPAKGLAGVCVNEGPDFKVEVQEVDVPEPSEFGSGQANQAHADGTATREWRAPTASQLYGTLHE